MKKFTFLTATAAAFLMVAQAFCATYYVSPTGNDENDGLSPKTPWASIARVNAAKEILPGDQILWQRGGLWRGTIRPHSGEPGNPVCYGAYGKKEAKPTFYGSLDASKEADWVEVSPNIWATRETKPELLGDVDGKFEGNWSLYREKDLEVPMTRSESNGHVCLSFDCKNAGKARNQVQLWGPEVAAADFPKTMILTLKVRASQPITLPGPSVSLNNLPWTTKTSASSFEVSEEWKTVDLVLTTNDTTLPETGNYRFVWHWSFGGVPAGTKFDVEFVSLKEALIDASLHLSVDVGNIIFDHGNFKKYHCCGMKKWSMEDLKAPCDYYYDPQSCRVFLYWDENPAKTCESIELALRRTVIDQSNAHDVTYENLAIAYGAAHGFGGANTARLIIRSCDLYFIGGGHQFTHENGTPVRFGNAIEFWNSCEKNLVENCHIREVYDAALTNQGKGSDASPSNQRNITYRNNLIENSEYSFEYWNRDGVTENILFENNTCVNSGICWSHSQRPNPNGAHMMFYQNSAETKNFVIRGNKFFNSSEVCLRMENDWRSGLTMEKNDYQQFEGAPVIRWLGKTYADVNSFAEIWQKELGMDQESTCSTQKTNP